MTHFVQCIWDHGSIIKYHMAHSEEAHLYFLKGFYKRINKKEYKSQILEHNICHTNIIAMQDVILIAKVAVRSTKKKELVVDTPDAKITRVCSATNIMLKYNWHPDLMDNKAAVKSETAKH